MAVSMRSWGGGGYGCASRTLGSLHVVSGTGHRLDVLCAESLYVDEFVVSLSIAPCEVREEQPRCFLLLDGHCVCRRVLCPPVGAAHVGRGRKASCSAPQLDLP